MKKTAKVAALLAAMVLAAGLTACQGKGSSKGLVIEGATVKGFTPDVPAKISIPKGISKIRKYAFKECLTLVSVTIPDTVAEIGENAFTGCTNLKSVTIPGSVKSTGEASFWECTKLENVTIGNGVKLIDWFSFYGCTSLKSVTLPASVTKIYYNAFEGCDKLEVNYAGTKAQWEAIEKDDWGSDYTVSFTVHCKDGDVAVEVTK